MPDPENGSDFWIFPFFWIIWLGQPPAGRGEVYEYLKKSPKQRVGMAFAKIGPDDGLLSSRSFWNSFSMLPIKKGDFTQEGAASLSSSRKESRK